MLGGTDLAIAATGLRKDFGSVHAVRGIDLEIRQGEIVAFLGPNGAGKTTTIDMILGLSDPTAGTVTVLGQSPRSAIAHGLVAAVMQTAGLLKDISVRETLELTGSLFVHHVSVDAVMKRAGISDIGDRRVNKCSGGQQQRLRFAMALLSDPELLILDEPTTGMDVTGRRDFWAAIRQDATRGRTILFATHYLEEADEYADRIILVRQGRDRGRRHRRPDQGHGRRSHGPRDGARRDRRPARGGARAPTPSSCAARSSGSTRRTPTRSPATCSPRPTPTTSRSSRAASRTPSSP